MDQLFLFSITEIKIRNLIILFIGCAAHSCHVSKQQQENAD